MERLNEEEVNQKLDQLSNWERSGEKWIERKYHFKQFLTGVAFVNDVAEYAESKQHHPMIAIDYKKVTLKMSSWQAKGLTDLDIEMAKHFDELYNKIDE